MVIRGGEHSGWPRGPGRKCKGDNRAGRDLGGEQARRSKLHRSTQQSCGEGGSPVPGGLTSERNPKS